MKRILRSLLLLNALACITNLHAMLSPNTSKFVSAYRNGDLAKVTSKLTKQKIGPIEAGMCFDVYQDTSNIECSRVISAQYPYACWDAYCKGLEICPLKKDNPGHLPMDRIKTYLQFNFILPFVRVEVNYEDYVQKYQYVPLLHSLALGDDEQLLESHLKQGANPRHLAWCTTLLEKMGKITNETASSDIQRDAYYFLTLNQNAEKRTQFQLLLDKYAQPADGNGNFNTTDHFYPGTIGYRKDITKPS